MYSLVTNPGLNSNGVTVFRNRLSKLKKPERYSEKYCFKLSLFVSFTCPHFEQKLESSEICVPQFRQVLPRKFFVNLVIDFMKRQIQPKNKSKQIN